MNTACSDNLKSQSDSDKTNDVGAFMIENLKVVLKCFCTYIHYFFRIKTHGGEISKFQN